MTRQAAICIPLLCPVVAIAADAPVIAVVGVHQTDVHVDASGKAGRGEDDASTVLAGAVTKSDRATAVHGADVAASIAGRQQIILEEALLSSGRRLLAEGRNLRNQALFEDAVPLLAQAVERLEEGVVVTGDLRDLWEAWVLSGACHLALGDTGRATDALREAIALNPGRAPDPAQYPPDVIALHASVREASQARPGSLEVRGPEGMALAVDGRVAGVSPARVQGLLPGVHHVRAYAPGRLAVARATLDGGPVTVELTPGPPRLASSGTAEATRSREMTDLYRAFGRHTEGIDYLLIAGTQGSLLHLQLYDVRADVFSRPTSVPFADDVADEARQMVPLLLNLLGPDGALAADSTQGAAVPLDRGANGRIASLLLDPVDLTVSRPRRRLGVWAGVGAGALLAGGITGAALAVSRDGPRYNGTVTIGPLR